MVSGTWWQDDGVLLRPAGPHLQLCYLAAQVLLSPDEGSETRTSIGQGVTPPSFIMCDPSSQQLVDACCFSLFAVGVVGFDAGSTIPPSPGNVLYSTYHLLELLLLLLWLPAPAATVAAPSSTTSTLSTTTTHHGYCLYYSSDFRIVVLLEYTVVIATLYNSQLTVLHFWCFHKYYLHCCTAFAFPATAIAATSVGLLHIPPLVIPSAF